MREIAAKVTTVDGITYRSRNEARLAKVFYLLGINARYEPRQFRLESTVYTPDFYLPDLRLWVESKPNSDHATALATLKLTELRQYIRQNGLWGETGITATDVAWCIGQPFLRKVKGSRSQDLDYRLIYLSGTVAALCQCPCGRVGVQPYNEASHRCVWCLRTSTHGFFTPALRSAYTAAKKAFRKELQ